MMKAHPGHTTGLLSHLPEPVLAEVLSLTARYATEDAWAKLSIQPTAAAPKSTPLELARLLELIARAGLLAAGTSGGRSGYGLEAEPVRARLLALLADFAAADASWGLSNRFSTSADKAGMAKASAIAADLAGLMILANSAGVLAAPACTSTLPHPAFGNPDGPDGAQLLVVELKAVAAPPAEVPLGVPEAKDERSQPATGERLRDLSLKWSRGGAIDRQDSAVGGALTVPADVRGLRDMLDALGPPRDDESVDDLWPEHLRCAEWLGLDPESARMLTEHVHSRFRALQQRGVTDSRVDSAIRRMRAALQDRVEGWVHGMAADHKPKRGKWLLDARDSWRSLEARCVSGPRTAASGTSKPAAVRSRPVGDPAPGFSSVLAALESAEKTCNHLVFLERARSSAADSPFKAPERVHSALLALNDIAGTWLASRGKGGMGFGWKAALRPKGLAYKSGVSPTALGNWGHEYEFVYEGVKRLFGKHITLGAGDANSCLSIHFFQDDDEGRVLIGHVGRHLTNTSS